MKKIISIILICLFITSTAFAYSFDGKNNIKIIYDQYTIHEYDDFGDLINNKNYSCYVYYIKPSQQINPKYNYDYILCFVLLKNYKESETDSLYCYFMKDWSLFDGEFDNITWFLRGDNITISYKETKTITNISNKDICNSEYIIIDDINELKIINHFNKITKSDIEVNRAYWLCDLKHGDIINLSEWGKALSSFFWGIYNKKPTNKLSIKLTDEMESIFIYEINF